jgi:hypothetical protein
VAHLVAAAEEGGFDRDDSHYTRTAGRMDAEAWDAVASELKGTLVRIEKIVEDSEARLAGDAAGEAEMATVLLMHFSGPSARALTRRAQASVTRDVAIEELPPER